MPLNIDEKGLRLIDMMIAFTEEASQTLHGLVASAQFVSEYPADKLQRLNYELDQVKNQLRRVDFFMNGPVWDHPTKDKLSFNASIEERRARLVRIKKVVSMTQEKLDAINE